MEHNILSLDFWQDTVTYEGQTIPTGTLGCAALNITDAVIDKLEPAKHEKKDISTQYGYVRGAAYYGRK